MQVLTNDYGVFSSYFDKIIEDNINDTLKEILIDNHTVQDHKRKQFDQLAWEHIFGFGNNFRKITKGLGFQITFETNVLQNIVYTTSSEGTINYITFNKLHLFVPNFFPSPETHIKFHEYI